MTSGFFFQMGHKKDGNYPPRQKIAFQVCCHLTPVILYACHLSVIRFALDKKAKFRPIFGHNSLVVNIIRDSSPFATVARSKKCVILPILFGISYIR